MTYICSGPFRSAPVGYKRESSRGAGAKLFVECAISRRLGFRKLAFVSMVVVGGGGGSGGGGWWRTRPFQHQNRERIGLEKRKKRKCWFGVEAMALRLPSQLHHRRNLSSAFFARGASCCRKETVVRPGGGGSAVALAD